MAIYELSRATKALFRLFLFKTSFMYDCYFYEAPSLKWWILLASSATDVSVKKIT